MRRTPRPIYCPRPCYHGLQCMKPDRLGAPLESIPPAEGRLLATIYRAVKEKHYHTDFHHRHHSLLYQTLSCVIPIPVFFQLSAPLSTLPSFLSTFYSMPFLSTFHSMPLPVRLEWYTILYNIIYCSFTSRQQSLSSAHTLPIIPDLSKATKKIHSFK